MFVDIYLFCLIHEESESRYFRVSISSDGQCPLLVLFSVFIFDRRLLAS